ncbi:CD209 antigen-like protein E [Pseudorasbora parva]|uniref:CD209 antigen-like protein E n=1 Tax=Pseudorasbora parva TaxID=51549 RepID=UPI00351F34C0
MSDYTRLEISAVIYECVSRTELQDIDRGRVEMMLDICDNMRDHDFRTETNTHKPLQRTGSDSVRNRSSRAAAVCLGLLCVLLLTAVIVLCVHIQTKSPNYTEERDQLLIKNINLKNESRGLLNQINNLTKQRDQLNHETNELWKSLSEMGNLELQLNEWMYYKFHLYFISSEKKNWTESRRYCRERGADLIIINNREEQDFVTKMSKAAIVWIGLNDSDEEDRWKWVDGSTLNSE